MTQEEIGKYLGISHTTLRKAYREELDTGAIKIQGAARGLLVKKMLDGDRTCLIFFLKTRCGFRETGNVEISGPNGGPLNVRSLTPEQIVEAIAATEVGGSSPLIEGRAEPPEGEGEPDSLV